MDVQERHDAQFPVPEEWKSVPGNARDDRQERFFNWGFPESDFWETRTGRAHRLTAAIRSPEYKAAEQTYKARAVELVQAAKNVQTLEPAPVRSEMSGTELADALRAEADRLGFDVVGITRFHKRHVYVQFRGAVHHHTIVIVGVAESYELANKPDYGPCAATLNETLEVILRANEWTIELARFLLSAGYRVQVLAGLLGLDMVKILPYAAEAGMGQMGANGQLLSPFFGSRWRPIALSTDAPLALDHARDFGINKLCDECQVCVTRCPGRALSPTRVMYRGVDKYKVVPERCIPMVHKYAGCGICVKTCPVQRYGLQAVIEHYESTGEILGKHTDELEGYDLPDKGHMGPGKLPRFTAEEKAMPYELAEQLPTSAEMVF